MAGLLADLSLKISANTAELNKGLEKAKTSVNKFGKQTKSNSKKVSSAFTKIGDKAKGMATGMVGQFGIAGQALAAFASTFGTVIVGINGGTKALKLFKLALASTGVGAIVVALGSLVTYLASTQEGMDKVTAVTRPVAAVFQKLLGVVQTLGGSVFKGLGQILSGEVTEGFKTMGQGVKDAVNSVGDAVKTGIEAGTQLDKLQKKIVRQENELIVNRARLNAEFEKYKELAQDQSKSDDVRLDAARKAQQAQNSLLNMEQSFLDLKIQKMKLEHTLNDTSLSDEKELATLIAERTQLEAKAARKRASAKSLENTVNKQIQADLEKQIDLQKKLNTESDPDDSFADNLSFIDNALESQAEKQDISATAAEESAQRRIAASNEEFEAIQQNFEKQKAAFEEFRQKAEIVGNAVGSAFQSMGYSVVDSFNLAENGFQGFVKTMAKTVIDLLAMALSQSISNAIVGATASSAATGPAAVFTQPAFIATAVGGVLSAFAAIPKFFNGGLVKGPPTGDQTLIRANGGEMMLNKAQQGNLFNMINQGGAMGGTQNIRITGTLVGRGNDLVAVIDETNRQKSNNF